MREKASTQLNVARLYDIVKTNICFDVHVSRSVNENFCGASTSGIKQNYIDCQLGDVYIPEVCVRHICEHSKQQLVRKVSMGRDEMEIMESALAFKSIRIRVKHKGEKRGREEKVWERSSTGNKASSRAIRPNGRIAS